MNLFLAAKSQARKIWAKDLFLSIALTLGILANILPLLVSRYLPFTDLAGHMGLLGALVHQNDPQAQIHSYFSFDIRLIPSIFYDFFVYILSPILPLQEASQLFIALFIIAAMPLSMAYALHAFGKDPRLSILSLPLLYHRSIWYGFVNFMASVPALILSLALLNQLLQTHPTQKRRAWTLSAYFSLATLYTVACHAFGAMVLFGLCLWLALYLRAQWQAYLRALAGAAPAFIYLFLWETRYQGKSGNSRLLAEILGHQRSFQEKTSLFYEWTIHGIQSPICDLVLLLLGLSLVLAFIWTLKKRSQDAQSKRRDALAPPLLLGVTSLMYWILPMEVSHPYWWAVCVRLVPLIWLFSILSLPRTSRRTPAWLLSPALAAGIAYGAFLAYDFRFWFRNIELAGFEEALEHIPKGVKVHALWPDFENEKHYAHFPMAHFGAYYTVNRGGLAIPAMDGTTELWVRLKPFPPAAGWGLGRAFSWRAHGRHWDYFLQKTPAPGFKPSVNPFRSTPPGSVELVGQYGLWAVYKRVKD